MYKIKTITGKELEVYGCDLVEWLKAEQVTEYTDDKGNWVKAVRKGLGEASTDSDEKKPRTDGKVGKKRP